MLEKIEKIYHRQKNTTRQCFKGLDLSESESESFFLPSFSALTLGHGKPSMCADWLKWLMLIYSTLSFLMIMIADIVQRQSSINRLVALFGFSGNFPCHCLTDPGRLMVQVQR
jgi:hypothetical protein